MAPLWTPPLEYSRKEEIMLSRMKRVGKLYAFLRRHRHELFDIEFQQELIALYRDTKAGEPPNPPAMMAMAVLLQGYAGASDAEAVELALFDARWQMVLGCWNDENPPFSQGALQSFRQRMIAHDLDRRVLERTVELARKTKEYDARKLPKSLRVAIDSSPLEGAGRVEDTVNLLGKAARKVVLLVAALLPGRSYGSICQEAGIPLLLATSIKKGLDLDWDAPEAQTEAISRLTIQLDSLKKWVEQELPEQLKQEGSGLQKRFKTIDRLRAQDLESIPESPEHSRIRQGVAPDRQCSIEDPEMRHGRKSKSQLFNGYKRHIVSDLDDSLILACGITPANQPEKEVIPLLQEELKEQGAIDELYIDRGYIDSSLVQDVLEAGGQVICRAWPTGNSKGLFPKDQFQIDVEQQTITCPGMQTKAYDHPGQIVRFDGPTCSRCELRSQCTQAAEGRGRTVTIAKDEALQQQLRAQARTPEGRERLRKRVTVEHHLAHVGRRQGRRARYKGIRKNLFDLRRSSTITNLEAIDRVEQADTSKRKAA